MPLIGVVVRCPWATLLCAFAAWLDYCLCVALCCAFAAWLDCVLSNTMVDSWANTFAASPSCSTLISQFESLLLPATPTLKMLCHEARWVAAILSVVLASAFLVVGPGCTVYKCCDLFCHALQFKSFIIPRTSHPPSPLPSQAACGTQRTMYICFTAYWNIWELFMDSRSERSVRVCSTINWKRVIWLCL